MQDRMRSPLSRVCRFPTPCNLGYRSTSLFKTFLFRFSKVFKLLVSICIAVVSLQLTHNLLKTTSLLLSQDLHLFHISATQHHHPKHVNFQVYRYHTQKRFPQLRPEEAKIENAKRTLEEDADNALHDYAFTKFVLVLDLWERMINVQSGLRRLVQLGVDSGFTVVEPFVYESKVSHKFAFPEQFHERNMTPQTASLYFRTEELYVTNRYISHEHFRKKIALPATTKLKFRHNGKANSLKRGTRFIIQSVVYIDWSHYKHTDNRPFYWCNRHLQNGKLEKSRNGWRIGPGMYAQRMLCLSSSSTMLPSRFTAKLFQDMFAFVKKGTRRQPQNCRDCITLAFINYRKHAFTGFVSHTGAMPFMQKTPPLEVGREPQRLAEQVRSKLLKGKPYVAIQIRTGKAFVLLEHYERQLASKGTNFTQHEAFKEWLTSCTASLVKEARVVARQLGRSAAFYIASDMYNDGWKGGEACPPMVKQALEIAKKFLDKELKRVYWFKPSDFGIKQDAMGISGLADAAVCLKADRFMFTRPSNFGRWVHEQRMLVNDGAHNVKVDCMDARFVGS